MKNLNIKEVAKIEKCECTEVCEACTEKHSHSFPENNSNTSSITGDVIANIVLANTQPGIDKELMKVLDELAILQIKLKRIIEKREKHTTE